MIKVMGFASEAERNDRLEFLVGRVAARDRTAFRCLYAFQALPVWCAAIDAMRDEVHAAAVTRSTFLESWHLARHHAGLRRTSAIAWIAAITAVRIDERLHLLDASRQFLDDYDRQVDRQLAALLGAGQATIRIGPASFARVDDLHLALATIATARQETSPREQRTAD